MSVLASGMQVESYSLCVESNMLSLVVKASGLQSSTSLINMLGIGGSPPTDGDFQPLCFLDQVLPGP